ncbi:MAG: hypothetical protein AB1744_05525 [Candidatus Zixiibacteriota bacterium]
MRRIALLLLLAGLFVGCSNKPQTFEELTDAGERAFLDEDYARARGYFSEAAAKKPSDKHVLYLLGVSYARDFLYDSAFHYLKRADLLHPRDREINLELYRVARALEEWKTAIRAIHVLIERGDPPEQHYRELAELNMNIDNYAVAYTFYRRVLAQEAHDPDVHLHVANLAAQLDSIDVALRVIDSAIEQFGPADQFLLNKSLFLAGRQQYREAERILRSLLAGDTGALAYKLNLANILSSQDDRAKKEEAYRLYLELNTLFGPEDVLLDSTIAALRDELGIGKQGSQ